MSLSFNNAEKRINDVLIFPSFSLTMNPGNIVAIQSTVNVREQLLNLLLRKTALSSGEVMINDIDISCSKQQIGFLFLNEGLYERLTIQEMLSFTKKLYQSTKSVDETIHAVQLDEKKKEKITNLSYSEKKRVQLASLLIQNPDTYILEEPDQNSDLESRKIFISILNTLREDKKTVCILTGNLESAIIMADDIYRLDENGIHCIQTQPETEIGQRDFNTTEMKTEEDLTQPATFKKIPTKVNEKIILFNPPEIDYIESNDGQSSLHINGESFPTVFTLNELEERLLPFGFFRCHRSYIVNLQKVREVITWTRNSYSLVLDNTEKSTIPLSKSKMVHLKEMIGLK